jgi:hypothetical protein
MAEVQLTVTVPDNAELQAKMIEAIEWMNRDIDGNPRDMTPAQAKSWLEEQMRNWVRRKVTMALQDKVRLQAEDWQI